MVELGPHLCCQMLQQAIELISKRYLTSFSWRGSFLSIYISFLKDKAKTAEYLLVHHLFPPLKEAVLLDFASFSCHELAINLREIK